MLISLKFWSAAQISSHRIYLRMQLSLKKKKTKNGMNYDASFVFRFFFSFAAEKKNRFEVKTDWKRKKNQNAFFSAVKMTCEKRISLSMTLRRPFILPFILIVEVKKDVTSTKGHIRTMNDSIRIPVRRSHCTHSSCELCNHKFHRYIVKTSWFYYNVENWVIFHKRRWNELNNLSFHFQMVSTTNKIRRTLHMKGMN